MLSKINTRNLGICLDNIVETASDKSNIKKSKKQTFMLFVEHIYLFILLKFFA